MNFWITTDTHFGHDKLMEYAGRPEGFEKKIFDNHRRMIHGADVLIHLGDICIGNDEKWHEEFTWLPGSKWLVRGNHDNKTIGWYLTHGWDFVADRIFLKMFGMNILLSHFPIKDNGYDINIHGHFHNSDHRRHEPEFLSIKNPKHKLIMLEHHYSPQKLRKIVGQ